MKDFIKWLGVNEKIAKVVVWLLIIMIMLILTNAALDSMGFSHYKLNYNNFQDIKMNIVINSIVGWIVVILNFFSIVLLIFPIKKIKKIFPYSILYLILNVIVTKIFNFGITQAFIITFVIGFCYFFSNKNNKYLLYSILSIALNMGIQGITYLYKIRFIDFKSISYLTQALLSIDYFIIMGIIILVKEIYLKKRSEKICGEDIVYFGSENSKKKETSQRN